jgi:hypothetical protein
MKDEYVKPLSGTDMYVMDLIKRHNIVIKREYWNRYQASKFLGIAPGTLSNWLWKDKKNGTKDPVPVTRISRKCVRFLSTDLADWAKRRGVKTHLQRD